MFDPSLVQPLPPVVANQRMDAALQAARTGARGRNRAETRELVVAELRARGLMPPPPAVDALVDLITAGPMQRQAQHGAALAKATSLAFRSLSAAIRHRPLPSWDVTAIRGVGSTLPFRPIEVILDQNAGPLLEVGDAGTFEVWFALAAPSSPGEHTQTHAEDAASQPVTVFRGDLRIGVLDLYASATWRPLVHEGRDKGHTVATFATRRRDDIGKWRLLVGLPFTQNGQPRSKDASAQA